MKKILAVLAVAFLSLSAASSRADLLGSKVNGSLTFGGFGTTNFFDPANGFVPAGYGNSTSPNNVVIGSGIEFGFNDSVNRDIANFSGTGLLVRDVCLAGGTCGGNNTFVMTFTDLAFTSATLLTNSLGITYSFSGDTLTINYPGNFVDSGNATATFLIGTTAPTPEPGTMALVATGILGAAGAIRRRLAA